MLSEFHERGVDVSGLRIRARQQLLTQAEYDDFLTAWYNIIVSDFTKIHTLTTLVKYLKNGRSSCDGASPVYCVLAGRPSSGKKTLGKFYIVLFKFICSIPPFDIKQRHVANILKSILTDNGYNVQIESVDNKHSSVSLDGQGFRFLLAGDALPGPHTHCARASQ